jgi:hypothetical protein
MVTVPQPKHELAGRLEESSMPDEMKTEETTLVRKIKSENELDQVDDSILDQVSGGKMPSGDET